MTQAESEGPLPDVTVPLGDANRRPMEVDVDAGDGPALLIRLTRGLEVLIGVLLIALLGAVAANVAGRNLFNTSLPWADELSRMLFVWMVFMGAAAAFVRLEHVAVDYFIGKLPRRPALVLYLLQNLIVTGVTVMMLVGGFRLLATSTARSAILRVPWNFINVSAMVCALIICLVAIWRIARCIRDLRH